MDTQLKTELYDSYHSLLNRVRFAFIESKHSIEEAFIAAGEEMQKLGNLTEEELHHIAEVLREDLREIGSVAHSTKEGLRSTIDFDRQYLSHEIRDKLLSIADKTILDRLSLEEELKEHQRFEEK